MKLSAILTQSCIKVPLAARDKDAAIAELIELLAADGQISDAKSLYAAVLAREHTRSTGIGRGLAVPHGKSPACSRLVVAVGKPAEPIDFGSIDGQPVDVIVLLASPPDQTGPHIQALARISRLMLMEPFRVAVSNAKTAEALFAAITQHDG
ncbi:MAG: PTS sugar transporter subunit IIA [Phycisphaerae bacterium]|nr:PTS sugar transporter subunit IIA [Phycisphaerae bacterium]